MKIKKRNITILLASLLILAATATVHSEEPGDKVLKQVTLDGKEETMELIYQGITEYNPNGKIIYIKTQEKETWYEYNEQGDCIYTKYVSELKTIFEGRYTYWYEYTYYPDGTVKTRKSYFDADFHQG